MSRKNTSSSYLTPVSAAGVELQLSAGALGRGAVTLVAATTYYFPVGGQDAGRLAVHLQHDAGIIITSATIEDCCFPEGASDVSNYTSTAGAWLAEDPSDAYVAVAGANTTATQAVVDASGGAAGGAMWHIETAARRSRLKIVVGGTGGQVRVAQWGKE